MHEALGDSIADALPVSVAVSGLPLLFACCAKTESALTSCWAGPCGVALAQSRQVLLLNETMRAGYPCRRPLSAVPTGSLALTSPQFVQVLLSDEAKRVARRRGHAPVSPGPDESPGAGGGDAAQSPWRVRILFGC